MMCPVKIRISLSICLVLSEALSSQLLVAKDPLFLQADSEDFDKTGRVPRPRDYKHLFTLNSTEHKKLPCPQMLNCQQVKFICRINAVSESFKPRKNFFMSN